MYLMTKCGKSGIKAVYNYQNNDCVITRGRQNVTSESTHPDLRPHLQETKKCHLENKATFNLKI